MKVTSEHTAADKVDCQISFVWQDFGTLSPGAPAQLGNGHWSLRLASDSASSWVPSLPLQPPPLYPGSNSSNPHLSKKKKPHLFLFFRSHPTFLRSDWSAQNYMYLNCTIRLGLTYIPHKTITSQTFPSFSKVSLCPFSSILFSSSLPRQLLIYIPSVYRLACIFLSFLWVESYNLFSFLAWLLALSAMILRSIHIVVYVNSYVSLSMMKHSIAWIHHSVFIHLCADGFGFFLGMGLLQMELQRTFTYKSLGFVTSVFFGRYR